MKLENFNVVGGIHWWLRTQQNVLSKKKHFFQRTFMFLILPTKLGQYGTMTNGGGDKHDQGRAEG